MNDDGLVTVSAYLAERNDCQPDHIDAGFSNLMHSTAESELSEEWDDELEARVYYRGELEWAYKHAEELAIEEQRA